MTRRRIACLARKVKLLNCRSCRRLDFISRFVFVGTGFSRDFLHGLFGKGIKNLYSRFLPDCWRQPRGEYRRPPLGTPRRPEDHTWSSTSVNDVNVTSVDRPSMAKLHFVQHPCCKLLIINSVSGVITGCWSVLVDWSYPIANLPASCHISRSIGLVNSHVIFIG